MKVVKYRFFQKSDGSYTMEEVHWTLVGTNGIDRYDPRAVSIGTPKIVNEEVVDLWVPLIILKPAFDSSLVDHVYSTEDVKFVDNMGRLMDRTIKKNVVSFSRMDVYAKPLLPGYIEITMEAYNTGIANYVASLPI